MLLRFLYFLPRLLPFLAGAGNGRGVVGEVGCAKREGDTAVDAGAVICMSARDDV